MDRTAVVEEYVKRIYELELEYGRRVRTTEIANAVDRTKASVTSMIKNLDDEGVVEYQEYKGVSLTETGKTVALEVIRNHRILETFLAEELGVPWPDVHDEADTLEHHVSEDFIDRLETLLGSPRTDPHGEPIPDAQLQLPAATADTRLTDCDPGDYCVIDQVPHRQQAVREYLFENRVHPDTTVVVEGVEAVGMFTIRNLQTDHSAPIPKRIARRIRVQPVSDPKTGSN